MNGMLAQAASAGAPPADAKAPAAAEPQGQPQGDPVAKAMEVVQQALYGAEAARDVAKALKAAGLQKGDRVATLCWNHHAHLECYFGIPAAGGVLHTLNLRLSPAARQAR